MCFIKANRLNILYIMTQSRALHFSSCAFVLLNEYLSFVKPFRYDYCVGGSTLPAKLGVRVTNLIQLNLKYFFMKRIYFA